MPKLIDDLEFQQGMAFAEAVHGLVSRYGPSDLSANEREALGQHLIISAADWVLRRNRLEKATNGL